MQQQSFSACNSKEEGFRSFSTPCGSCVSPSPPLLESLLLLGSLLVLLVVGVTEVDSPGTWIGLDLAGLEDVSSFF